MLMASFDRNHPKWTPNPEVNMRYLKTVERQCNDILREDGFIFFSDVADLLEIPDPYEQAYGWLIEDAKKLPWDIENFVSFGIYNLHCPQNRSFVNGLSPNVILNFNPTGDLGEMFLDRAIRRGFECCQDYFNYPQLFLQEINWKDYI